MTRPSVKKMMRRLSSRKGKSGFSMDETSIASAPVVLTKQELGGEATKKTKKSRRLSGKAVSKSLRNILIKSKKDDWDNKSAPVIIAQVAEESTRTVTTTDVSESGSLTDSWLNMSSRRSSRSSLREKKSSFKEVLETPEESDEEILAEQGKDASSPVKMVVPMPPSVDRDCDSQASSEVTGPVSMEDIAEDEKEATKSIDAMQVRDSMLLNKQSQKPVSSARSSSWMLVIFAVAMISALAYGLNHPEGARFASEAMEKVKSVEMPALPEMKIPEFNMPEVNLSEMKLPEINMPEVNLPEFNMPEISLPEMKLPEVSLPEMPEWEMPAMPEMDVSAVKELMTTKMAEMKAMAFSAKVEPEPVKKNPLKFWKRK